MCKESFAVVKGAVRSFVKEWNFFVSQGGLRTSQGWGKNWYRVVEADDIEHARDIADNFFAGVPGAQPLKKAWEYAPLAPLVVAAQPFPLAKD